VAPCAPAAPEQELNVSTTSSPLSNFALPFLSTNFLIVTPCPDWGQSWIVAAFASQLTEPAVCEAAVVAAGCAFFTTWAFWPQALTTSTTEVMRAIWERA
jgi:hypothetical protein